MRINSILIIEKIVIGVIMLIQFRVENYKSFDKEQKLSMVAGSTRNNSDHVFDIRGLGVLKTAVVFGSNASGKSNLIKAMAAVRNLLLFNIQIPPADYCRIKPENKERTTAFEFVISIGDERYVYGIELMLSTGNVESEWFKDISKSGTGSSIFLRNKEGITTDLKLGKDKMFFDVYGSEAGNNPMVPFLTILSRVPLDAKSGLSAVHRVLRWFSNSLRIISAGGSTRFSFTSRRDAFTKKVLPAYGTGISGIEYQALDDMNNPIPSDVLYNIARSFVRKPVGDEPAGVIDGGVVGKFPVFFDKGGRPMVKKMMFDHDGNLFEYYEESDGTNRLFDLTPILDPQDEKELVYVIDELDKSLHPQLTKKFVSDFEKLGNGLRRQLITTTHESRLMDMSLLRRDEMWFVEKNAGASSIYSLEEFNERSDRRIDKAYLDGRYGAVPCFREIFPDMIVTAERYVIGIGIIKRIREIAVQDLFS